MVGLFARWQPEYEAAGLAVFPVDGDAKKPAVTGYLKVGTTRSRQLADKFQSATALGFACGATGLGRRNAITVLDIDEPDENLLADAFNRFGHSPVVIKTGSGKYHAWYRHNGERRKIRGVIPGRSVDVLGNGFALAPPSLTAKGEYQFIQGSLADVGNLPVLQFSSPVPDAESSIEQAEKVAIGERNNSLFRACMAAAFNYTTMDGLADYACSFNASLSDPLPDDEVMRTVVNAWGKTLNGENWFGGGRRLILPHDRIDRLLELGPDATALMLKLQKEHWGRTTFVVANAMAKSMPGGAWNEKRFAATRSVLLAAGELAVVRPASMKNGPALFRFGDLPHVGG